LLGPSTQIIAGPAIDSPERKLHIRYAFATSRAQVAYEKLAMNINHQMAPEVYIHIPGWRTVLISIYCQYLEANWYGNRSLLTHRRSPWTQHE